MYTRNKWVELFNTPSINICQFVQRFYYNVRNDLLKHMGQKMNSCFLDKVNKFIKQLQLIQCIIMFSLGNSPSERLLV